MLKVIKFPWTLLIMLLRVVLDVVDPQPKVAPDSTI